MTNEKPASKRLIFAEIALSDDPTPNTIIFYPNKMCISLNFVTISDAYEWGKAHNCILHPIIQEIDRRYANVGMITWHGWDVLVNAFETVDAVSALPTYVVDRLTEMVENGKAAASVSTMNAD